MEQISIFKINASEFDDLVKKTYNQDFEFAASEEVSNDSNHLYEVKKNELLFPEVVQEFRDTGEYCCISRYLLQDMVNNDVLPEGNYLITEYW
jgi:hypothetical protein